MGNNEFAKAKEQILEYIRSLGMEEVNIFMRDFIPSYSLSLDEQHISL